MTVSFSVSRKGIEIVQRMTPGIDFLMHDDGGEQIVAGRASSTSRRGRDEPIIGEQTFLRVVAGHQGCWRRRN